jgi:hypothetical protein
VKAKVAHWAKAVESLSEIAKSQPHAAFAAFTHCLQGQWTFLCRSMPNVAKLLIRHKFIPAMLRREVNDAERDILALPARLGGLGLLKPRTRIHYLSAHR